MVILYNRRIYQFFDQWIITILFQKNTGKPTYQSDARNGKHKDIVWQVNLALMMKMMVLVILVVVVMMVIIMMLRMCCLGEVGHRQFGWLSQLLLCFRGWKVFTQFMSKILDGPFKNHLGFQWRFSIINVSIIPGWPTGLSWRQHFGRFLEMIEKRRWIKLGQISHNIWRIAIVYF